MLRILFLIHDLGQGGAEKVLVNLVNNMDPEEFDVSVISLFGGGVNERFLKPHVHYHIIFPRSFPGNSHFLKLLSPARLHRFIIRDCYDVEVSYLEGPCARIVSGCAEKKTKLLAWIHSSIKTEKAAAASFRGIEEMRSCYLQFQQIICVSKQIREYSRHWLPPNTKCRVLYNTVDSDEIRRLAAEPVEEFNSNKELKLIAVGSLKRVKGYDRLLRVILRLSEAGYSFHLYLLGTGPMHNELSTYVISHSLVDYVSFLGYQTNPFKYVAKCDLFLCSSYSEGFSTAAMEALIVGTPVCTVDVSGMKEMLGDKNEFGMVTTNDENSLYNGIKMLFDNTKLLEYYRIKAKERGDSFSKEKTVKDVEEMLKKLC